MGRALPSRFRIRTRAAAGRPVLPSASTTANQIRHQRADAREARWPAALEAVPWRVGGIDADVDNWACGATKPTRLTRTRSDEAVPRGGELTLALRIRNQHQSDPRGAPCSARLARQKR